MLLPNVLNVVDVCIRWANVWHRATIMYSFLSVILKKTIFLLKPENDMLMQELPANNEKQKLLKENFSMTRENCWTFFVSIHITWIKVDSFRLVCFQSINIRQKLKLRESSFNHSPTHFSHFCVCWTVCERKSKSKKETAKKKRLNKPNSFG